MGPLLEVTSRGLKEVNLISLICTCGSVLTIPVQHKLLYSGLTGQTICNKCREIWIVSLFRLGTERGSDEAHTPIQESKLSDDAA
jgi:hypothetical protein